jgi:hypothetical protein
MPLGLAATGRFYAELHPCDYGQGWTAVGARGRVGDAKPGLLTAGGGGVRGCLSRSCWATSGLRGYVTRAGVLGQDAVVKNGRTFWDTLWSGRPAHA